MTASSAPKDRYVQEAEATAAAERRIQQEVDRRERAAPKPEKKGGAMQAGARRYPEPPLPGQHVDKPGRESDLALAPMFDAPHYKGSDKLKDKVALITGADSGIGRSVAVLFAREGADVAVAYLNEHDDAAKTKAAVEKEGRRCITLSGDVADAAFCAAAVERTICDLGRLDILVNNAAFQEHVGAIEDLTAGSAIVMTGSVTGLQGSKALIDYAMTKGGIHAFVRSLAALLIDKGIRVNAVAPGPVWTPFNPADRAADAVKKFGGEAAMKRPAQPEEIAPAFVFLAAPSCSSYITGEILPVIGGYG
jgi:NAD(P)-dependent dehydrogenase (short-subunit alcohol dehydrogenase family)